MINNWRERLSLYHFTVYQGEKSHGLCFYTLQKVEYYMEKNGELYVVFSCKCKESFFSCSGYITLQSMNNIVTPFSRSNNPILLSEPYCEQALCRKIPNNICLDNLQKGS